MRRTSMASDGDSGTPGQPERSPAATATTTRWLIPRWLGDVVDQGATGAAEPVVEVDAGGECEQALQDAGAQVAQGAGAVAFEAQQVFGRPVDRFDALADGWDVRAVLGLVGAGRAGEH